MGRVAVEIQVCAVRILIGEPVGRVTACGHSQHIAYGLPGQIVGQRAVYLIREEAGDCIVQREPAVVAQQTNGYAHK